MPPIQPIRNLSFSSTRNDVDPVHIHPVPSRPMVRETRQAGDISRVVSKKTNISNRITARVQKFFDAVIKNPRTALVAVGSLVALGVGIASVVFTGGASLGIGLIFVGVVGLVLGTPIANTMDGKNRR